jgi:ABC-type multidrug transport system fused ATPase/permease subunit
MCFESVVLRYRPTTEVVLDKLTFIGEPGEKIGVVGRTGAGKSTICLSLSRIVEIVEGKITIDNQDISKVHLHHLRASITVIPQDPTIFTGTLRFNLDPEDKVTDDRIVEVLQTAQLDELLKKEGLDL